MTVLLCNIQEQYCTILIYKCILHNIDIQVYQVEITNLDTIQKSKNRFVAVCMLLYVQQNRENNIIIVGHYKAM